MVKINIISGFLGAGKTTLIKKLLSGALKGEKVILLENEYGEVGVDGSFMKDAGIVVDELNSGCICCTLAGDFQKAIDELIAKYQPDRILVEPTGVGKLSEIIAAVEKCKERHPEVEIGGCATVVDAGKCRMYMKNFGEFFLDQVKYASTIIFSRTQLLSADRVEKSRALIAEQHPDARIITTPWDDLDADTMLRVIEDSKPIEVELVHDDDDDDDEDEDEDEHEHHCCHHHDDEDGDEGEHHCCHHHDHDHEDGDEGEHHCCHHHDHDHEDGDEGEHHCCHHHDHDHEEHHEDEHGHCSCGHDHHHHHHHDGEHDADEVFQNIGVETARRYEQDEIRDMVGQLADAEEYGQILRAKGILQNAAGEWFQFDYVPGELQMRPGTPDYTGRLCVIGVHIEEAALKALFKA